MPSIALSMIVKNAAEHLPRCLESVRGIADEICVADTGSSDNTIEIAREAGAAVVAIPWDNDFAAARNRALAEVHSDWVLSLDADESLDPGAAERLPEVLSNDAVAGYLVPIRNYVGSARERLWDRNAILNDAAYPPAKRYPAYVEHQNVRLFRRDPEIYFVGRVHETVGGRIEGRGGRLGVAPFWIHHFGFVLDEKKRAAKHMLYREMGRLKVQEQPENSQAHFELGLVEFDNFQNDEVALQHFQASCRLAPGFKTGWLFAGLALLRLKRLGEALHSLRRAGNSAMALEAQGDAHYNLGQFTEAEARYRKALRLASDASSLTSKLGLAELRCGKTESGLEKLRLAVSRQPDDPEVHDRLSTALVWMGRLQEAAEAMERKLQFAPVEPRDYLRAASVMAHLKNQTGAQRLLSRGLSQFPQHEALQDAYQEIHPA